LKVLLRASLKPIEVTCRYRSILAQEIQSKQEMISRRQGRSKNGETWGLPHQVYTCLVYNRDRGMVASFLDTLKMRGALASNFTI
jgi:hypothetical protein